MLLCAIANAESIDNRPFDLTVKGLLRCAGDEEPLVYGRLDGSRREVLTPGDVQLARVDAVRRVRHRDVGKGDAVPVGGLAGDEALPGLGALAHNVHGVLLVLALAAEGELVLGLAVGDLVDAEPLVGGAEEAWKMTLDVLDVVQLGRERVLHVDDDDLPICLFFVQEGHHAKDLHLLDFTGLRDELADLAHIQRVVVTLGLGFRVHNVWVLPSL